MSVPEYVDKPAITNTLPSLETLSGKSVIVTGGTKTHGKSS